MTVYVVYHQFYDEVQIIDVHRSLDEAKQYVESLWLPETYKNDGDPGWHISGAREWGMTHGNFYISEVVSSL